MTQKHWTETSVEDFQFKVSFDFVEQLQEALRNQGTSQSEFATTLGLTKGRVSQIINNPGNLTLRSMVRWSRALGQKVSIVLYDDGDATNRDGPVDSEIFRKCWEIAGMPSHHGDLPDCALKQMSAQSLIPHKSSGNNVIYLKEWRRNDEAATCEELSIEACISQ